MPIILIIALIAAGGTGISVAAQNALPGDLLYGVKIGVNENVKLALTLSSKSKGILSGELAARRLAEAEELITKSKFSPEFYDRVVANFKKHSEKIKAITSRLEAKDNLESVIEVNSNFESRLRAHERVLANFQVNDPEAQGHVSSFLELVRNDISSASLAVSGAEEKIISSKGPDVEDAAKGKLKAAENKIAEVRNFIDKINEKSGAEAVAEAEARLQVAQNTLDAGRVKLNAALYGEAFQAFQKSIRIASEAQALASARNKLGTSSTTNMNPGSNRATSSKATSTYSTSSNSNASSAKSKSKDQ